MAAEEMLSSLRQVGAEGTEPGIRVHPDLAILFLDLVEGDELAALVERDGDGLDQVRPASAAADFAIEDPRPTGSERGHPARIRVGHDLIDGIPAAAADLPDAGEQIDHHRAIRSPIALRALAGASRYARIARPHRHRLHIHCGTGYREPGRVSVITQHGPGDGLEFVEQHPAGREIVGEFFQDVAIVGLTVLTPEGNEMLIWRSRQRAIERL